MNRQDAKTPRPEPDEELDGLARVVVDAAIEVHRHLGPGFLEQTYARALAHELGLRGVPCVAESPVRLVYKGVPVGGGRLDLLVGGRLIVELKSVAAILPVHHAQVIACLKATGHTLALLINFNEARVVDGVHRIIHHP